MSPPDADPGGPAGGPAGGAADGAADRPPEQRLVTVLLTLAVPAAADPEDAAALAADAAAATALHVVHATGVEGHLPAPGATVVRAGRAQPWTVVALTARSARLRDLAGDVVEVPRTSVLPDPLAR
ncbi:hypothetical protein [Quadrisphaera sp. DSM 44207]|uniref:hypothetical protein n=1 Tax=Quadrisphaera sp. DSM 44207 TaxID=1881057 RepID=UPI00088B7DE3|nr:hypothetical protein [Quadrisphaera sp. DSM 44207]SDQ51467.1 hypothetical protein SAMN05428996_2001 [Quadrisphaera sp. DSM 44207]